MYRTSGTYAQGMGAAPTEYKIAPLKVITLKNCCGCHGFVMQFEHPA